MVLSLIPEFLSSGHLRIRIKFQCIHTHPSKKISFMYLYIFLYICLVTCQNTWYTLKDCDRTRRILPAVRRKIYPAVFHGKETRDQYIYMGKEL